MAEPNPMQTRFTRQFGVRLPIVQGAMSWASSGSALASAVSNAGGLGTVAAGPMRVEAFAQALVEMRQQTTAPWAVNIPLYNPRAADYLELAHAARVPILIASQGGPAEHLARFHAIGTRWLHVVTTPAHARKAVDAGVDGLIAVGGEAGGHPAPSEVSTLVLTRALARQFDIPLIAAGGVADGFGIAALLALGADAVQLGTRFLATTQANVHADYKTAVVQADIDATTLVGRGRLPIRQLRNAFSARYLAAEQAGEDRETLAQIFQSASLKQAALEGDVDAGKPEAGQSAGLIDSVLSVEELMQQLTRELAQARQRLMGI